MNKVNTKISGVILKWISFILLFCIIIFLIFTEVKQHKASTEFCKKQCTYYPENKKWGIDLQWFFDENGVKSRITTSKFFDEKNFNGCISYCKELESEYKYLTY